MKKDTINKLIKHLTAIKEAGISIKQYQDLNNLSDRFIFNKIAEVKTDTNISKEDYNKIMSLYDAIKTKKQKTKAESDNRSEINLERDENGRISKYEFTIYIRDKAPLTGTLTRDEMSLIYRLYSSYGSNITQREVSRFFPEYSLCDFKRILRTFNITKASSPFPQHILEESSKEQLLDMQFREKENDFLRSYEAEKVRQLDGQLKKYMKENSDLKEQLNTFSGLLDNIDLSSLTSIKPKSFKSTSDKDLFIWLSDMHIGASVADNSIYANNYNRKEVNTRLNTIIEAIGTEEGYNNIIVCNLGDSLDGYSGQTTRGGHYLPQNMNNKEQVKCFIEEMSEFFIKLDNVPNNGIKYYVVGESNHGGDFEYAAQLCLTKILSYMGVECTVFDSFIGNFTHNGITYCISHGKDATDMFKNWPLILNDKTENFINEYLDYNNIHEAIVVKGDLHQSATSYGKRIKYKSVGSLFGGSEWCQKNFGNTKACCDYSIVDDKGNMLDGRIILN